MESKTLLIGIALLLLAMSARGAVLEGTCKSESVQCELTLSEMQLCNDSDATQEYRLHFQGEVSKWFNVLPDKLTLDPDECSELKIYTVANCYAQPGDYSSQLIVQNDETLQVSCNLKLNQGHFVDIDIQPAHQEATECEEKIYELLITNKTIVPNQNTERVDITISGLPKEWYELEEERVLVEKGKPQKIKLKVQAPCQADFGTYEFVARAALPNPNFYSEDRAEHIIGQGQAATISLDAGFSADNFNACVETRTEAYIKLTNNGKLPDTFRLSLQGAGFAELEREEVNLEPGTGETIKIFFKQTSQKEGNYEFTIIAKGTNYEFETSKQFRVALQDCYNIEVEKLEGEQNACVEDAPEYKFSLRNNRTKTVDLDIELIGIESTLDKTSVTIAPGKSEEISAEIDAGKLTEAQISRKDVAIELIIDSSGSMIEKINDKTKMQVAKGTIVNLVNNITQIDLGLRILGQGNGCEDPELLVPISTLDIPAITDKVAQMKPKGKTPLAQSLTASIDDFNSSEGKSKVIILVSDGKETCNGSITESAKKLSEAGIITYTIGFDIDEQGKAELQEIAARTNGRYFDAKDSEQLLEVFRKITQELNIVPSEKGRKNFTLRLSSENFSFEKDYSLIVSDCYNASLLLPEVNVCPGIEKQEELTIVNLGTEPQEFEILYTPSFVNGEDELIVQGGKEKTLTFALIPPTNRLTTKFEVQAKSSQLDLSEERNINYLSASSCFGTDIILPNGELDAATCEGIKQTLFIENRGVVREQVKLTVDKGYVHIVNDTVDVEVGEREEVNFFVSPPFDLPATTFITFRAETDRGFETSAQIKLMVAGNEGDFGLGEVDIRIQDINAIKSTDLNYDVQAGFDIYNDSNRTMEIFNISSADYNAAVTIENRLIAARSTARAKIFIDLKEEDEIGDTIIVPIKLETDEGTFVRDIEFEYGDKHEDGGQISIGTGLFSLASISTIILIGLIILVIALIALSTYKAIEREQEAEKENDLQEPEIKIIEPTEKIEIEKETVKKQKRKPSAKQKKR